MSDIISRAEVQKHKSPKNCWIIIHNNVYDVSRFLKEHPGGEDTLLGVAGTDATQAFEDVGHSDDARILLKNYKIGCLPVDEGTVEGGTCCPASNDDGCDFRRRYVSDQPRRSKSPQHKHEPPVHTIIVPRESRWWLYALLALGIAAGGAFAYKKYGGGGGA